MSDVLDNPVAAIEDFIKITTSLSTERDLNRLLNIIVSAARKISHSDAGMVYILDETKRHLGVEVYQCGTIEAPRYEFPAVPLYINNDRNMANLVASCAFMGKPINIANINKYS